METSGGGGQSALDRRLRPELQGKTPVFHGKTLRTGLPKKLAPFTFGYTFLTEFFNATRHSHAKIGCAFVSVPYLYFAG
ncbi:MAG: hypothetical protein AAFX45_05925 [Pseudomonadota bacterium]